MDMKTLAITLVILLVNVSSGCKDTPPGPSNGPDTTSHAFNWSIDTVGQYSGFITDLWGTDWHNVYGVGLVNNPSGYLNDYLFHFDGNTWTPVSDSVISFGVQAGALQGISGLTANDIVVVGASYNSTNWRSFAARWNGSTWSNISPNTAGSLRSVWMRGSSDIFAVGAHGLLLHYDGAIWDSLTSPTILDYQQVVGVRDGTVYAVACDYFYSPAGSVVVQLTTDGGTIAHSVPGLRLFSLAALADGTIYAVGEGVFVRSSGLWSQLAADQHSATLHSVSAVSGNNIMTVGAYGVALHWNGASWWFYDSKYMSASTITLLKVLGFNQGFLVAGTTGDRIIAGFATQSGGN